jgi:uncharacterized protein (DUF433 family)
MPQPNLLKTGIYTVSEAAYLVGVSQRKIRGWIDGYPRSNRPPIVDNELGWVEGRLAFSFTNLMEIRFIAFFEKAGVHFWHIRAIMHQVKHELDHPHPFATNIVFRTDGRKVVEEIAASNGITHLFDLRSRNFEMHLVVLESLVEDVVFDPKGDARSWYPRRRTSPHVIVHPRFSFGRPVLERSRIPTRTIADAVRAQGKDRAVAMWFEIPESEVREAVKFEAELRKAP